MAEIMLGIGLLIFLAHVFTALFERWKIPDVLLLMCLGLILGPATHLITPADFGKVGRVISTVALIVILFESGITLDPKVIGRNWRPILSLTMTTFIFTVVTCALVAHFFLGLSPIMSVIAGSILGGVSAAVAIALVKSLRLRDPTGTVLVMESAVGDVLSIVLLLSLMESASEGTVHPLKILGSILASVTAASIFGVVGGIVWLYVLNQVRRFPNTAFTTLAFVFLLYGFTELFEFSGAIAALAFGATITNHGYLGLDRFSLLSERPVGELTDFDIKFYGEILFLLKTFFFVYLGVSIRFANPQILLAGLVIVAILYLGRPLLVRWTLAGKGVGVEEASTASIMVPKGLVSAVLATMPLERRLEGGQEVRSLAYMVVLFSILATAILIPLVGVKPLSAGCKALFRGWVQADTKVAEGHLH